MTELEIPTFPGQKKPGLFSRIKASFSRKQEAMDAAPRAQEPKREAVVQTQPPAQQAPIAQASPKAKSPEFSTKPLEQELGKINAELDRINKQLGTAKK